MSGFRQVRNTGWISRQRLRRRRGVAVLMVLLLISMTLGLSYAAIRSQSTALRINRNSDRRLSARTAAVTGLTMALKKMSTRDWAGVDTTLTGVPAKYESFQVTYTTGDPSLTPGDPDYEEFPYRVTLLATGYAADPDRPESVAAHRIRAVVRLIPRALASEPDVWPEMTGYTLYQHDRGTFAVNVPLRVEGPVRIQRKLDLAEGYSWKNDAKERYLGDLEAMRSAGQPDWRPLNGPLDLPHNRQEGGLLSLLETEMNVPTNDVATKVATGWRHPGPWTTYQIYPGGKVYRVPALRQNQWNVRWEPDPLTNPLGIYYRSGPIYLYNNVTIRGTLVCTGSWNGDLHFRGRNVHLQSVDLPPLEGTDVPVRLPLTILQDDLQIWYGAEGSITGLLTARDDFEIKRDQQYDMSVAIEGQVVARDFQIRGRSDWDRESDWWKDCYDRFVEETDGDDDGNGDGGETVTDYFPLWLQQNHGLDPNPRLTVKPETTKARYHWHESGNPIYVPHPDDDGLRWDLLQWTEGG